MHAEPRSRNDLRPESPVRRVIRLFGAARAGAVVNLTTDAIRKWDRPIATGGGGGLIPARYQQIFLDEASAQGIELEPADLIAAPHAPEVSR